LQAWWIVHRLLQLTGLVCSITVASKMSFLPKHDATYVVVAWLAAVCMGVLAGVRPSDRAKGYHAAWHHLKDIADRYPHDDSVTTGMLFDARKKAWAMIKLD